MPQGTKDNWRGLWTPALRHNPLLTSGQGGTCAQGELGLVATSKPPCLQSWEQEGDLREAKSKGRKLDSLWAMYASPLTEALKYESAFFNGQISHLKKVSS